MRGFAVVVATLGGLGRVPVAPGTAGSLAALPLVRWVAGLRGDAPVIAVVVVAVVLAIAFWAADRAAPLLGVHDHPAIVVDEVAGMAVAALWLPPTWGAALLGFALFRLVDVTKPWPAGLVDRRVPGGLGVVGDDLVAGVYAGLAARLLSGVL